MGVSLMGPAEPDATVACLVHKNTGWRNAPARQSALRVRIALRKDGTAQGGWHGERPATQGDQRELAQAVAILTTVARDLGKGRLWCDLGTFPTCRHPEWYPQLDCGILSHLTTAHRGAGQGLPCQSHSAREGRMGLPLPAYPRASYVYRPRPT